MGPRDMNWTDTNAVKLLEECVRIAQEQEMDEAGREVTSNGRNHEAIARRLFACQQAEAHTYSVRAQLEIHGHSAALDVLAARDYS